MQKSIFFCVVNFKEPARAHHFECCYFLCLCVGGKDDRFNFIDFLLVEVFACSRQPRQLFVEDVFFGAHTVIFHVLCPVQLTHVKVKYLQQEKQETPSVCFSSNICLCETNLYRFWINKHLNQLSTGDAFIVRRLHFGSESVPAYCGSFPPSGAF